MRERQASGATTVPTHCRATSRTRPLRVRPLSACRVKPSMSTALTPARRSWIRVAATSAILAAAIYDGSVRNSIVIMASAAMLIVVVFLLKPLISPAPLIHHPDELARD